MKESQARDLEAETEAETMKEHCLLAGSPWLAQLSHLCSPGSRGGTDHSDLGPPTSVANQGKARKRGYR